ncbi:YD repeat-containing protein [Nitrospirillum amazonense]|uniref:YD repeat-containing protein n=1 Tax=Nitrospirillum amazonense TaxID=28077 RepID=A0A560EJA2_9PROT|nr:RHS repeat domain-containing protein [Nitrospirillum amazonense]TWB09305.1 YD repeat-containing protein [Nitrospirillum amazonense]
MSSRSLRRASVVLVATALFAGAGWAGDTKYEYDTLGRLTKVTQPSGATTTYNYDAAGNRTAVTTTGGSSTTGYSNTKVIVLPLLGGFVLPLPSTPW